MHFYWSWRVRRVAVASLILLVLGSGQVAASALTPGSDAPACRNKLTPGEMQACSGRAEEPATADQSDRSATPAANAPARGSGHQSPSPPSLSAAKPMIGGVSDDDIQAFLANHGKPPIEAVRALLNPTDENIRALVAQKKRQLLIAAYVAERTVALEQEAAQATALLPRDAYTVMPHFIGMQLAVYVTSDCRGCPQAIDTAQRLVEQFPVLDVKVIFVGDAERDVVDSVIRWAIAMPVAPITIEEARAKRIRRLPTIELRDARSGVQRRFESIPKVEALREAVLQLRQPQLAAREEGS